MHDLPLSATTPDAFIRHSFVCMCSVTCLFLLVCCVYQFAYQFAALLHFSMQTSMQAAIVWYFCTFAWGEILCDVFNARLCIHLIYLFFFYFLCSDVKEVELRKNSCILLLYTEDIQVWGEKINISFMINQIFSLYFLIFFTRRINQPKTWHLLLKPTHILAHMADRCVLLSRWSLLDSLFKQRLMNLNVFSDFKLWVFVC